jgi:hypothetical protein
MPFLIKFFKKIMIRFNVNKKFEINDGDAIKPISLKRV